MSKPVLTYTRGRGRGECVRIALCGAGIEYDEVFVKNRAHFLELRDKKKCLMFGEIPLLEIDGKQLVQGYAIIDYIGRKYGLYGKNADEAIMINMLKEGARDFYRPLVLILFYQTEEEIIEGLRKNQFVKFMPIYEKYLSEGTKQFLVGDNMSIADLALLEVLLAVEDYMGLSSMDGYPKVKAYYLGLKKHPNIQNYITKHRRPKNDYDYIAYVNEMFGW